MRFMIRRAAAAILAIFALASCTPESAPTSSAVVQKPNELLGLPLPILDPVLEPVLEPVLDGLTLLTCSNNPGYGSVTKTIGPLGGTIAVGPHSLVIPPRALAEPTAITATAPAGSLVRVDFEPHGLRFSAPTALTLSYRHCLLPPLSPRIVYLDDANKISEVLQPSTSLLRGTVTGKLDHFSGYVVAEGRARY